jgi:hypothetical protein
MTYLAGFIVVTVKVSSILIGCVRPAPANRADAGLGEVESGKPGSPLGSPLHYSGRGGGVGEGGEVMDFPISSSYI